MFDALSLRLLLSALGVARVLSPNDGNERLLTGAGEEEVEADAEVKRTGALAVPENSRPCSPR